MITISARTLFSYLLAIVIVLAATTVLLLAVTGVDLALGATSTETTLAGGGDWGG